MRRRISAWVLLAAVMLFGSTIFGWLLTAAIGPRSPDYGKIWGRGPIVRPVAATQQIVGRQFTAFQPPRPLTQFQIQEFQRVIESITRGVTQKQLGILTIEFHHERMALEEIPLGRYDLLGQTPTQAALESSGRRILQDIQALAEARPDLFPGGRVEIIRGSWSPDQQEALVLAKHLVPRSGTRFVRWWMCRDLTGTWRVYDFDVPNTRLRFLTIGHYLLNRSIHDEPAAVPGNHTQSADLDAYTRFQSAFEWLMLAGSATDPAGINAGAWMDPIEQVPMLRYVQGARYLTRARQMALSGDVKKTDAAVASVLATMPNAAHQFLARAVAANANKQWAKARDAIQQFRDAIGDDPIAYLEEAKAVAALEGPEAAIRELRKGLTVFPGDAALSMEIIRRLPPEKRESFGSELAQTWKPTLLLTAAMLFEKQSPSTLDAIVTGWLREQPADPTALRVAMFTKLALDQPDSAGAILKKMTKADQRNLVSELSNRIHTARSPLSYYRTAAAIGEGRAVFRACALGTGPYVLGAQTPDRQKRLDILAELADAHRKTQADDPYLNYASAIRHQAAGELVQADGELVEGLAKLKPPQRTDRVPVKQLATDFWVDWEYFRSFRTELLHRRGKWKQAYAELQPAVDTFDQLAMRLAQDRDEFALAELIELHAKAHPDDLEIIAWRGELSYLKKDHENTVRHFKEYRDKTGKENRQYHRMTERMIRSLVRMKRPAEAREILDEATNTVPLSKLMQVLVAAAEGDVDQVLNLFDQVAGFALTLWYVDPDLGPLLREPAFERVRQKYPPPVR